MGSVNREGPDGGPNGDPPDEAAAGSGRSSLLYCGQCGALNPVSNAFCAACGTILVDAFHGTEGLRVYERPDAAARLVTIVPSGNELEILPDAGAPADFARVRVANGQIGYVRLPEVEALPEQVARALPRQPDINTHARGCVSSTAALAALVLLVVTGALGFILLLRSDAAGNGILTVIFCLVIVPFLLLTIGLYLYARTREDRLAGEEEDAALDQTAALAAAATDEG